MVLSGDSSSLDWIRPISYSQQWMPRHILRRDDMLNIANLVGLPVKEAESQCRQYGMVLRVRKRDSEPSLGTCEYSEQRINVCVRDGKISKIEEIG